MAEARTMDPATLTMQAVAERLGVDRKALNYHVSDRDGLLELVALNVLHSEVAETEPPLDADWRDAVRHFARTMRAAMVRTGALFEYVRVPVGGLSSLAPAERLAETLMAAGFDDQDVARALGFIAEFVFSSARDAIMIDRHGVHPQVTEIQKALDAAPAEDYRTMRRLMLNQFQPGDAQLEFDLRIFIAGMDHLLSTKI
ncbi:AcrR family transcriptional regulator [Actinoplanes lutulentus]|nr:TetR/AcrR family transcriptional regulator C-terminal domain-containing protein [Actinoplanes lutulentus]MBB2941242.1 AcrR family transcriptional regulator [Actinoplanes lutulentus]